MSKPKFCKEHRDQGLTLAGDCPVCQFEGARRRAGLPTENLQYGAREPIQIRRQGGEGPTEDREERAERLFTQYWNDDERGRG